SAVIEESNAHDELWLRVRYLLQEFFAAGPFPGRDGLRSDHQQEGPGMRQHGGAIRPYYPIWASDDVWTPENPEGKYPRPIGQNWFESGTGASSFWIRNGAYLRRSEERRVGKEGRSRCLGEESNINRHYDAA